MPTTDVVEELVTLEKRYWQAIKDGDAQAAALLSDEPCIVAGAQGVGALDRKALMAMMEKATYELERFQIRGTPEVRLLSKDVAIIAYKVHEDLTVDGEKISLDAADSSTWVRRDGRWVCALHTESIQGDPFGRDRERKS